MPRVSNSGKRHQGANGSAHNNNNNGGSSSGGGASGSSNSHHANGRDTRHENGLVGPGKRVSRQRSQNNIENAAKTNAEHATAVPPVPTLPTSAANGFAKHHDDTAPERTTMNGHRGSLGGYSESTSTDSLGMATSQSSAPALDEMHRRIDVNDAKNSNVHRDPGPLELVLNVLRSCPLQDTIAILIILMNVSPTALTWIYMLFTLLTFVVPPVTTSSGLSITEIIDGNNGTPSLTTLICMDVVMLGIWLFLLPPMQQFILDLSQVVISLTLGGGGSSRQGVARNMFLCVAVVGVTQWTRHMKLSRLSQLTSLLGASRFLGPDPDDPLEPTIRPFEKQGPYGWFRSIFAIHIVTQGLVRYIREWYLRREKRDQLTQSQLDPEAAKLTSFSDSSVDPVAATVDGSSSQAAGPATTTVSTKKRRKQSALVRIRQPLWAALASTKIVMVKEYELSHAASESAGSNATDIHNLGNATFNTQPEQIWICYIGSGEVCFNTSHFPDTNDTESYEEDRKSGVDRSKPFYVRVNKAVWQPTRIVAIEGAEEEAAQGSRWTGDIYGLTPLSNYECEFVSTETEEIIFATSLRTIAARTTDVEAASSKAMGNPRSRQRHDSPATTLRASISASEADLADKKTRLKSARKEHNRKVAAIRKDIEKLSSVAQSAGSNDEKLKQKIAQNKNTKSQHDAEVKELTEQIREFEKVPKDLQQKHDATKHEWTQEKARYEEARAEFKQFKGSIEKEIKALEDEQSALQAKRNKIATRIAKADTDHARITDANRQGLNEAQRRLQQRADFKADLKKMAQGYHSKVEALQTAIEHKKTQIAHMSNQVQEYLSSIQSEPTYDQASPPMPYNTTQQQQQQQPPPPPQLQQQQQQQPTWGPSSAHYSSSNSMWPPTSAPSQTPALVAGTQVAPFPNPLQTASGTPPHPRSRGRSMSMLSNVSGFTQATDEEDPASNGPSASATAVNALAPPPGLSWGSHRGQGLGFGHGHSLAHGGLGLGSHGHGRGHGSTHGYSHGHGPGNFGTIGSGAVVGGNSSSGGTIRPPPGFGPAFSRQLSDGGSGSGSAPGSAPVSAGGSTGSGSGSGSGIGSGRSSVASGSRSGGQSPV